MLQAAEIRTGPLTPTQLELEIGSILATFRDDGWDRMVVSYYGSDELDSNKRGQEKTLLLTELRAFLAHGSHEGFFEIGTDDLSMRSPNNSFEFVLTHDGEIELKTWNMRIAGDVRTDWEEKGYAHYEVDRHTWYALSPTSRFWMEGRV